MSSENHLSWVTTLGTGLLLGTALGVIIPEGIEALLSADTSYDEVSRRVALSLLVGFICMLVIEQTISKHSHSHEAEIAMHTGSSIVEFDAELGELETEQPTRHHLEGSPHAYDAKEKAFPITVGLVIHSIADGLALGVSFFSGSAEDAPSGLSLVVFLAIIVHKSPTSLALTTSLLSTGLQRSECKKHLAVFASTTPLAAITTYIFLSLFGGGDHADWTGIILLISGGSFLYVATVLQPVSDISVEQEVPSAARITLIVVGIILPFILSSTLGHGH